LVASVTDSTAPGYADTVTILGTWTERADAAGIVTFELVPNASIVPAGTVYEIVSTVPRLGNPKPRYFTVPDVGPVWVKDHLTELPGALPPSGLATGIETHRSTAVHVLPQPPAVHVHDPAAPLAHALSHASGADLLTPAAIGAETPVGAQSKVDAAAATLQFRSEKGEPSGYASLDGTGLVPASQLPASSGGGAHPDLVAHDTLGLATQVELDTAVGTRALDSAVVHNTGDETVAGVKTFSSASGTTTALAVRVTGDANDRLVIRGDGTLSSGPGGTDPPALALHFGSTVASGNTSVGRGAGNAAVATGSRNTALGRNALGVVTTGALNTAVGTSTLAANTASSNTAVGSEALFVNTTGGTNTAIGARVMLSNTTGYANTAIGSGALANNTTGYQNVAIGRDALKAQRVTFNNTAVGNSAGVLLDAFAPPGLVVLSGADNTIIGLSAMAKSVLPSYCVAMGIEAGRQFSSRGRIVTTGATTNGSATFTATGAAFAADTASDQGDVGREISAAGIPAGTTILAVVSATEVTMSANATATAAGLTTYIASEVRSGSPAGSYNIAIGRYALDKALGIPANGTTTGLSNIALGNQTGFMSRTQRDYAVMIGEAAAIDGNEAIALGHNTRAGAAGAVAIGCDSAANGATTTVADEIKLGTALHTTNAIGNVKLGGGAKTVGFYGSAGVAKQTGVAVTAAAIHAALVSLGLIAA
jgi:hypothetical protein